MTNIYDRVIEQNRKIVFRELYKQFNQFTVGDKLKIRGNSWAGNVLSIFNLKTKSSFGGEINFRIEKGREDGVITRNDVNNLWYSFNPVEYIYKHMAEDCDSDLFRERITDLKYKLSIIVPLIPGKIEIDSKGNYKQI